MAIDLHLHSTYSEGYLTPEQLVARSAKLGITTLSLTDHNTVRGVEKAQVAGKKRGVTVLPGVEIYVQHKKHTLHLLGYNFDIHNNELYHSIHTLCHQRQIAVEKSIGGLRKIGFDITYQELQQRYPKSHHLGLGQMIDTLMEKPRNKRLFKKHFKGVEPDFWGIIAHYFSPRKPAHLPLLTLPAKKAISLIHRAGGFCSLGHPGQQLGHHKDTVILELQKIGLDAIEVFSPYHNWHAIEHYLWFANHNKLKITGGTDYHGDLDADLTAPLKNQREYYQIPDRIWKDLKKAFIK